jgi:hypothetical protein
LKEAEERGREGERERRREGGKEKRRKGEKERRRVREGRGRKRGGSSFRAQECARNGVGSLIGVVA